MFEPLCSLPGCTEPIRYIMADGVTTRAADFDYSAMNDQAHYYYECANGHVGTKFVEAI